MELKFCQSCGMPLENDTLYAQEEDGSASADYCKYCYENGSFTFQGSMEEMIELCVAPMVEGNPGMTAEQARSMMEKFFPTLKRWSAE